MTSSSATDLAEQMAALADLLGIERHVPWPEVAWQARERIEERETEQ